MTALVVVTRDPMDAGPVQSAVPDAVAYGPHVDAGALDAAVVVGCREALPRSVVFRRLAEFID